MSLNATSPKSGDFGYEEPLLARWLRVACCLLFATLALSAFGAPPAAGEFPAVLETAGVSAVQLRTLDEHVGEWSIEQQQTAGEILHLLRNFNAKQLDPWTVDPDEASWTAEAAGTLTWIAGVVRSWTRQGDYATCIIETNTPLGQIVLVTAATPRAWSDAGDAPPPTGEVRARAVLLGPASGQNPTRPLFLAERLQWRPTSNVPAGWLALAEAGFDVGLLDAIRHHAPFFVGPGGREAAAFYGILHAADRYEVNDLATRTRNELPRRIAAWQAETAPGVGAPDVDQRRRAMAQAAVRRAEAGFSSVAPLFLSPQTEVGRLVLIEGTARRATPIALGEDAATADNQRYYELEVFTPDSQNLPVVCCVSALPEGFPIGDAIREPVRVSGFFFKMWQYRSRQPVEAGSSQAYAPIVIGPAPAWLRRDETGESSWFSLASGVVFLLLLAAISWGLWRQAARDRKLRRRYLEGEEPGPINLP